MVLTLARLLVLGLDGLGVGLVGALCHDHVDQLARQVHVGLFQGAGLKQAVDAAAGRAQRQGFARGVGGLPFIGPDGLQAIEVAEVGQLDAGEGLGLAVGVAGLDGAVGFDDEVRQVAGAVATTDEVGHGVVARVFGRRRHVERHAHQRLAVVATRDVGQGDHRVGRQRPIGVEDDLSDGQRGRRRHGGGRARRVDRGGVGVAVGGHVDVPGGALGGHRRNRREVFRHGVGHLAEVVVQCDGGAVVTIDRLRGHEVVALGVLEIDRDGRVDGLGARVQVGRHRDGFGGLGRRAFVAQLDRGAGRAGGRAGFVQGLAQQLVLLVVDDEALGVALELAIARIDRFTLVGGQREEAPAVDGQVQVVGGGGDVALRELLGHGRHAGADADAVVARTAQGGRVHVGELGSRGFGAIGVGVGDVVADDLQRLAGDVQTGETLLEAHVLVLSGCSWRDGGIRKRP